jgi:hypothetical protein
MVKGPDMTMRDGGSAFPGGVEGAWIHHPNGTQEWVTTDPGMTIRQFYKAAAMKGLLAGRQNIEAIYSQEAEHPFRDYTAAEVAGHAGELADAMLEEDADHAERTKAVDETETKG